MQYYNNYIFDTNCEFEKIHEELEQEMLYEEIGIPYMRINGYVCTDFMNYAKRVAEAAGVEFNPNWKMAEFAQLCVGFLKK